MSTTIEEILEFLSKSHNIACGETMSLGNVVKTVFRANNGIQPLIVKIGLSSRAAEEVRMNWKGYSNLREIGAKNLLPNFLMIEEYKDIPIIIMSDCGEDFWHAARQSENPLNLYQSLTAGIYPVYIKTRRLSSGYEYLESLRGRLLRQYKNRLKNLIDPNLVSRFTKYSLETLATPYICFSSFDFTPEDVFITQSGVKYVDPLPEVLGNPIIDLACFAGVARDAYNLPASTEGYQWLENFAATKVAALLKVNSWQGQRLFALGRALQSALSASVRISNQPNDAKRLAKISQKFIQQFLE